MSDAAEPRAGGYLLRRRCLSPAGPYRQEGRCPATGRLRSRHGQPWETSTAYRLVSPLMSDTVYSCFDVETTGLDSRRARVIEIAVVKVTPAGETVGEWSTLIDAGTPDLGRFDIHGIRPGLLVDAPTFSEVAGDLMAELDGCVPVAHNASFDVGFVTAEWARAGLGPLSLSAVDTVPMARGLGLPGRLGDLSQALGVELDGAHRALDDSRALAGVLVRLLERGAVPRAVPAFVPPDPQLLPTGRSRRRSGVST